MKRVMMVMALVLFSILPARAHMIHLVVQHDLQGPQAQALDEMLEAYNHRPGHGAHIQLFDGHGRPDVIVGEPEGADPGEVLLLNEWLDTETLAGLRAPALEAWRRPEGLPGLPLVEDGSVGASVARDTPEAHDAFELVRFLAGPEAGRIWARVTGQAAAHKGAR